MRIHLRRNLKRDVFIFFTIGITCSIFSMIFHRELNEKQTASHFHTNRISFANHRTLWRDSEETELKNISEKVTNNSTKYILIWTENTNPFNHIKSRGRSPFIDNKCKFTNCYLTNNKRFLGRYTTKFHAILFSATSLNWKHLKLPKKRSRNQKYVVSSLAPASDLVITNPAYDNFFNWTWTYKLDSDILWRYIHIYDNEGTVVGPKKNMTWFTQMEPTSPSIEEILNRKTKAVAWIISECKKKPKHYEFVNSLNKTLREYDLTVDVYDKYSNTSCGNHSTCRNMITNDYYCYLSFEDYADEDFVTERILRAVQNYAIPIVMGARYYSSFLPPGSYLDAKRLKFKTLAKRIFDITMNITLNLEYFRWTNHYTFKSAAFKTEICNICAALNNRNMMKTESVHKAFRSWWNGKNTQHVYDTLLTDFLQDKEMRKLAIGKNYSALREVFIEKYGLEAMRKHSIFTTQPDVYVVNLSDFNFSTTTDGNVDGERNPTETTTVLVEDD